MVELVESLLHLPLGSHCVSFHVSREEAADHATEFIAGSPPDKAASYWVSDPTLVAYYDERLSEIAPDQVGCVRALDHEQVESVDGRLRPVEEVRAFVGAHPEGVSGGADTLSQYLSPENVPEHLEYEAWFDEQSRDGSRFLCPYDLRRVPPDVAPMVLRELGQHHSHAVLSSSTEPAVKLLQLFVFATPAELPAILHETHAWARREGYLVESGPDQPLALSSKGEAEVARWSRATTVDW
ncbi:MAG TPA: hypothetical protein VMH78_07555 [Thermoplasmata archaeon]|nr:hypothetical protein [Thermoplasmata archaeon]